MSPILNHFIMRIVLEFNLAILLVGFYYKYPKCKRLILYKATDSLWNYLSYLFAFENTNQIQGWKLDYIAIGVRFCTLFNFPWLFFFNDILPSCHLPSCHLPTFYDSLHYRRLKFLAWTSCINCITLIWASFSYQIMLHFFWG